MSKIVPYIFIIIIVLSTMPALIGLGFLSLLFAVLNQILAFKIICSLFLLGLVCRITNGFGVWV